MAKKKKIYKNVYKEAKMQAEQGAETQQGKGGPGGKKKLSFKSYVLGFAIVLGYVNFFWGELTVAIVCFGLFILGGILMGVQNLIFLAIGALMGLLLTLLNETNYLTTTSLVWSMFYTAWLICGFIATRKASKGGE